VLRKSISVDVHTHGGKTGVTSKPPPNEDLANAVRAGSLAVACLADVPDGPVLGRNADGVLAAVRPPEIVGGDVLFASGIPIRTAISVR
jgi:membrane dipeptidase